ncbi:MAG: hypothetical protein FVQ81_10025 [Candidatus Glassbacteria bacterium]|nr:hypothetical protein [Candidatus Glassbacteria bacterium]
MPDHHEQNFIVLSDGFSFPYSRGLMARSLMRAGLGSEQAYQIASRIQSMLLEEGLSEIHRRQLKQRTLKLIEDELGEQVADSYEKWKLHGEAIYVSDGQEQEPFSRGILAQSLLAAGLGPEIAHEVAERMAVDFSERGVQKISRGQLRRHTYSKLRNDFGQEYARHYLLWRTLKGPDKPLILLFSGATGTGKSSLAVEIAHRLGITRVIGTDTIREIMRGMISRQLLPSVHESSYTVWKTLERPFGVKADPVISAFQEQAQRVNVGVRAIMRRAVKENLSMILEGVHILPSKWPDELADGSIIIQILICTTEEESHRNRFITRDEENPQRSLEKYLENFESIRKIQDALIENSAEQEIFVVDNVDFDDSVYKIIRFLTGKMGERVEIDYSQYELTKEEAR